MDGSSSPSDLILSLTSQIVTAYLGHNTVPMAEVPHLIAHIHQTITSIAARQETRQEEPIPVVPVKKSVTPDYIICLEDGKKLKTLKRHLKAAFNMTPEEYRAKWNLPPNYPMVAPNYATHRSTLAKKIGLGHKGNPKG